jgi:hypothetical protein
MRLTTTAPLPLLPPLDQTSYPRTYRMKPGWMIFLVLLGVSCVGGGMLGAWYFGSSHEMHGWGVATFFAGVCVLFVLLGAYLVIDTLKSKVIVSADAIEIHDLRPPRRLRRDEIAGRRIVRTQNAPPALVLLPNRQDRKKLTLPQIIETDGAFDAWLGTIPDLDAEDLRKSDAEIAADTDLGITPDERMDRLARARRLAKVLNLAAPAALFWGVFFPRPYYAVISVLAVLPVVAMGLMARSFGLYRADGLPNNAHPNLAAVLMAPGIALALRAMMDIHVLDWHQVPAPVLLGAFALTFMLTRVDPTLLKRRAILSVYFVFLSVYAYGVTLQANALLDGSQPEIFSVGVVSKSVMPGNHPTWFLQLAPWGTRQDVNDVMVSRAFYAAVNPGDKVCVALRPGMLRIPWYIVGLCR